MPSVCQDASKADRGSVPVIVVAGAAGSGKTTLGRELARRLSVAMLDLDSLTNPLLDRLGPLLGGPHWNSSSTRPRRR